MNTTNLLNMLTGKTIIAADAINNELLTISTDDGFEFTFQPSKSTDSQQDVYIYNIQDSLDDLIDKVVTKVTSRVDDCSDDNVFCSQTLYSISLADEIVDITWMGESNEPINDMVQLTVTRK